MAFAILPHFTVQPHSDLDATDFSNIVSDRFSSARWRSRRTSQRIGMIRDGKSLPNFQASESRERGPSHQDPHGLTSRFPPNPFIFDKM